LSALLLATACGKIAKDSEVPFDGGAAGAPPAAGGSNNLPLPAPLSCDGTHVGPAPLTRLDGFELGRSMSDALREAPAAVDGSKLLEDGLGNSRDDATPALVLSVHEVAHAAALKLSQNEAWLRSVTDCDPLVRSNDECRDQFLERFLPRAYRRALVDEDRSEMTAVFENGVELGGDFASGVRAVVEVALQSPDFMYLIELGQDGDAPAGVRALTGYETAARLAYFLTAAPPDDELFAAAAQGPFTPSAIEAQARRLLGSAKSREALRHFYGMRFPIEDELGPNPEQGYTDSIAALAREESGRFLEDVTFDGTGTFRALLTEPSTWVNEPLAKFYGYPNVTGDAFRKIQLDGTQRGGLFTQSAFLHATSNGSVGDAVRRGLGIMRRVLCNDLPPPPPNVNMVPVAPSADTTLRMKLEQVTSAAPCQGCHRDINPIGFAFGHYDAFGRWLDQDNGQPIDSSGELYRTDASGPFRDAIELMTHIAESRDAKACFVTSWLSAAYRRDADPADACATDAVLKAFEESDGNLVELMVALAQTDNFRYRAASEFEP
jgi:hypothetical protein